MGPDPASPPLGAISAGSRAARIAYTIRAAAAAGIATALWQGLELTHGIWLAISAIVVLQPRRARRGRRASTASSGPRSALRWRRRAPRSCRPTPSPSPARSRHDPALLVLGSAARPDTARCPDDRAGVHLRPAGALARGRLLAVREIIGGVGIGLVLTAIPFPGE